MLTINKLEYFGRRIPPGTKKTEQNAKKLPSIEVLFDPWSDPNFVERIRKIEESSNPRSFAKNIIITAAHT